MDVNKLFEMQRKLDKYIYDKHGVKESEIFTKKVVAYCSEVGECSSEAKYFKYWSIKQANKKRVLEEYVDILHHALSIALFCGLDKHKYINTTTKDLNDLTLGLYSAAITVKMTKDIEHARSLLNATIQYGYQLGLTEDEVINDYLVKHEINYVRQNEGY